MKIKLSLIAITTLMIISVAVYLSLDSGGQEGLQTKQITSSEMIAMTSHKESSEGIDKPRKRLDQPGQFAKYHQLIRTRYNESGPGYAPFQVANERKALLKKSKETRNARTNEAIDWISRGPNNVPGRTRGIIAMPDDELNHWFAGAVAGGVWETTNGGASWNLVTPDDLSVSITSLDFCESSPEIIYAATGEQVGSTNTTFGAGVLVSKDIGQTWTQLASTVNYNEPAIWRIIVNPDDSNEFLYCSTQGSYGKDFKSSIYKSTDGGETISRVYESNYWTTQLIHDPENFDVLYATQYGRGIVKSIDRGETWNEYVQGFESGGVNFIEGGRLEIAIAPSDPNILYASAESTASGLGSDLYVSKDAGETWSVVLDQVSGNVDYLGGQGYYDNAIMVDPFNANVVYNAGVNVWRTYLDPNLDPDTTVVSDYAMSVLEDNTAWGFVNFGAAQFSGGTLAIGNIDEEDYVDVEVRIGGDYSQKAYRFTVNKEGAGVPDTDYEYQDYVDVPFEVWDTENDRQLMVSFRDQQEDGVFNLINQLTSGDGSTHSREYVYIHNVTYQENPNSTIAQDGSASTGHQYQNMYFFWPYLNEGVSWDQDNVQSDLITIDFKQVNSISRYGEVTNISDAYLEYSENNALFGNSQPEAFHPDHHSLTAITIDEELSQYRILNSSDGGVYVSNKGISPGNKDGDWTFSGYGYVSGQFYGADKAPGQNRFIGGLQDQGTWVSVPADDDVVTSETNYRLIIGGDGFEAIWNYADINSFIGGSQNNGLYKTDDGGVSFSSAQSGLEGTGPFITRLANSNSNPDLLFAITSSGVGRSTNFGTSWEMVNMTEQWGFTNSTSIEVSLASTDVVWVGAGMDPDRSLHVSVDQGLTFTPVNKYEEDLGVITGLATHPEEVETAFALFSFAKSPKILKTTDLGETWVDISGFSNGDSSSTGFPDVAVYSLLVRPDNPEIIWVGTEIGIVESTDEGSTWHGLDGFPPVPVWQMKVVDNQVVVATHGRGIFSAVIETLPETIIAPSLYELGISPKGELAVDASLNYNYDSVMVFVDGVAVVNFEDNQISDSTFLVTGDFANSETLEVYVSGFLQGHEYKSILSEISPYEVPEALSSYLSNFNDGVNDFEGSGFRLTQVSGFDNKALHTDHPYLDGSEVGGNRNYIYRLKTPIIISETNSLVKYKDVAIVEVGENGTVFGDEQFWDYVIVEATMDGVNWEPLLDGYDANFNSAWLSAYQNEANGNKDLLLEHEIDLAETFNPGDVVFIRFRLFSDPATVGWGWVIDDLNIQSEIILSGREPQNSLIYPNPNQGVFSISTEYKYFELLSLEGKVLKKIDSGVNFDFSYLKKGVYLIRVVDKQNESEVVRFVKN